MRRLRSPAMMLCYPIDAKIYDDFISYHHIRYFGLSILLGLIQRSPAGLIYVADSSWRPLATLTDRSLTTADGIADDCGSPAFETGVFLFPVVVSTCPLSTPPLIILSRSVTFLTHEGGKEKKERRDFSISIRSY